jgi:CRISPR-associated protein Csx10
MRIYYTLTTIDPIIVSQNNAATANHECLDYIPGSAILGAFAAQYYSKLSATQSWRAFHSGEVKFSPCYPLVNNEMALPTPASWNFSKAQSDNLINKGKYNTTILTNHSAANFSRDESIQYKQCRTGFVNSNGDVANVKMGNSTKTALNSQTGSAKEGQLFTYSFIESGQTFAGWVDLDDSDNEINNAVKTLLASNIRLGRSRNTEFGRVKLNIVETPAKQNIANNSNELVLWCISDSEFFNNVGLPTLMPSGKNIHPALEGATLIADKSFIRSIKVSRFNQKRQGLDTEQILIAKGSVLTYKLTSKLSQEVLNDIDANCVGINQQYGLGWLSVNPSWSLEEAITDSALFTSLPIKIRDTSGQAPTSDNSPLLKWLSSQVSKQERSDTLQKKVNELIRNIVHLYQSARKYHDILPSNEAGPSSTQWRRISEEVRVNNDKWQQGVFDSEQAICKAKNDELGWGITLATNTGQTTFADEIHTLIRKQDIATMRLLLEQLCRFDLSKNKQLKEISKEYNAKTSEKRSYAHG